ncbi:hypothetical protein [Moraxella nonliquefaciens]|uniref:hypothetical protein n=1 Tax=Moraxella nonliquefaciens TaxID=478 RepID=UPI000A70EE16|nr:hypothetical protein [Moraxella nonliquefaciens]
MTNQPTHNTKSHDAKLNDPQPTYHTSDDDGLSRGLLNILLVFLESAITLALRFDPTLRKLAYPLAERGTVVCIRTYIPHVQFYATFGYRGVLLDDRLPIDKTTPNMTVNAYSFQLISAITTHSSSSIESLQIRGNHQDVHDFKEFLMRLGVAGVIQNLLGKIKGKPAPDPEQKAKKQEDHKAKIAEQSARIDELTLQNHKLTTALAELQGKQKSTFIALVVVGIIALIAIIMNFF